MPIYGSSYHRQREDFEPSEKGSDDFCFIKRVDVLPAEERAQQLLSGTGAPETDETPGRLTKCHGT